MDKSKQNKNKLVPQEVTVSVPRIIGAVLVVILSQIILVSYAEFGIRYFLHQKQLPPSTESTIIFSALIILYTVAGLAFGFLLETCLSVHISMAGVVLFTILKMFGSPPVFGGTNLYVFEYLIIPVFYILGIYVYHNYKDQLLKETTTEKKRDYRRYAYYGLSFLVLIHFAMFASTIVYFHRLPGYESMKNFQIPRYEQAENVRENSSWYSGNKVLVYDTGLTYPSTELLVFYNESLTSLDFTMKNSDEDWKDVPDIQASGGVRHYITRQYENKSLQISLQLRIYDVRDAEQDVPMQDQAGKLVTEIIVYPFTVPEKTEDPDDE